MDETAQAARPATESFHGGIKITVLHLSTTKISKNFIWRHQPGPHRSSKNSDVYLSTKRCNTVILATISAIGGRPVETASGGFEESEKMPSSSRAASDILSGDQGGDITSLTLALEIPRPSPGAVTALRSISGTDRTGRRSQRHLDVDLVVVGLDRVDQSQIDDVDVQLGILDGPQGRAGCLDQSWLVPWSESILADRLSD